VKLVTGSAVGGARPGWALSLPWRCFLRRPDCCRCCVWRLPPIAVFLLVLYSYGKRFTDYPQVLLALAQFVAPVGAWIAVTGEAFMGRRRARYRGRHLDRWIRSDLFLSGRRGRSAGRDAVVSRARFGVAAALRTSTVVHLFTLGRVRPGSVRPPDWVGLWWLGLALMATGTRLRARDRPRE